MRIVLLLLTFLMTGCTMAFDSNGIYSVSGTSASATYSPCVSKCLQETNGNSTYVSHANYFGECAMICRSQK